MTGQDIPVRKQVSNLDQLPLEKTISKKKARKMLIGSKVKHVPFMTSVLSALVPEPFPYLSVNLQCERMATQSHSHRHAPSCCCCFSPLSI